MGQFNHPHVVKLYGIVTVEDPVSYTCLCSMQRLIECMQLPD